MKYLVSLLLLLSASVYAVPDCTVDSCFPQSETDIINQNQDQLQSISNSNNVGLSHPMVNQAPLIQAPVSIMGVDGESCAGDFALVMGGKSRARMRGVDSQSFGSGSEAWGLNAGYVWVQDNEACLARQELRLENAKLTTSVAAFASTQLACMNYNATLEQQGINTLEFMKLRMQDGSITEAERKSIEFCAPIVHAITTPKAARQEADRQIKAAMSTEPKFEKRIEREPNGFHDYHLHLGNFLICQACDEEVAQQYRDIQCTKCDPAMQDHIRKLRILRALQKAGYVIDGRNSDIFEKPFKKESTGEWYVSLNLKPNNTLLTKSKAELIQQELIFRHKLYPKVRGMFGAQRYKEVERLVRVN